MDTVQAMTDFYKFSNEEHSYDEWETIFYKCIGNCGSHEITAWNYYRDNYKKYPQKYQLKILLQNLYSYYKINYQEFLNLLYEILKEETDDIKSVRLYENKKMLQDYIDTEGYLTVYRGITQQSIGKDLGVSYTVDKDTALFFALRFDEPEKKLITAKVHVSDILIYLDNRNEYEVILRPYCKKDNYTECLIKMTDMQKEEFFSMRKERSRQWTEQVIKNLSKKFKKEENERER
jgi:hypothetical protein